MTRRYGALIRHGAYAQRVGVPSALQPYGLTAQGTEQARACGAQIAALLRETGWALDPVVWSSHQLRAWQTAQGAVEVLAGAGHEARVCESASLAERSLGSAANLTVDEVEEVLRLDPRFEAPPVGWKSLSEYQLPLQGAESLMMAGARVAAHLREVLASAPPEGAAEGQLTLFFGHGASFRHAASHLGILAREEIARVSMYHARPLIICYEGADRWARFSGAWKQRGQSDHAMD